jgi:histidinol-phosphate phosphatase family protein
VRFDPGGEDFLLVYGDILFDCDLRRLVQFHKNRRALVTMLCHPNAHPYDSDLIQTDIKDPERVTGFDFKTKDGRGYDYGNLINACIYVVAPGLLRYVPAAPCAFEKDVLFTALNAGEKIAAYRSTEYVMDIGVKERVLKAEAALSSGILPKRNLRNPQSCVFLDRDGTINTYEGLISRPEQIRLEAHAADALRRLNSSRFLSVMVTNQPVVARGMCDEAGLRRIHDRLETLLGREGAYLDAMFCCPHHPDSGYEGEDKRYKIRCGCRKPGIDMLKQSAERFNIGLRGSWMVGDSTTDIQTGINAGAHTILLRTGLAGNDGKYAAKPDFVCDNLNEAVTCILEYEERSRMCEDEASL